MPLFKRNRSAYNKPTQLPTPGALNPSNVTTPVSVETSYSREGTGYFPQYSPRARSPEPRSMTSSTFLNPQVTRKNSSRYSACSSGGSTASAYLTPPEDQPDTDAPPYKARWSDSNSLTMLPKRDETMSPADRPLKKWAGQRKMTITFDPPKMVPLSREQSWHTDSSHTSRQEACNASVPSGKRKPSSKTPEELLKDLYSKAAPPIETRRWSSVKIGAKPLLYSRATTDSPRPGYSKGSSFYRKVPSDMDLIEDVRAKLKTRKAPWIQMQTPATITLRRASGASHSSPSSLSPINWSPRRSPRSGSPSPSHEQFSKVWRSADHRKSSAYLITGSEIESIARHLEENLWKSRRKEQTPPSHTSSDCHFQPRAPIHRPSVCGGFISVKQAGPADVVTTLSEADTEHSATPKDRGSGSTPSRRSSLPDHSTVLSASSIHEIIWEIDNEPPTLKTVRSTVSADGFLCERTMFSTTPGIPSPAATWTTVISPSGLNNQHLSPSATPLIKRSFEWSESKPRDPADDTPKATPNYDHSAELTPWSTIPLIVTDEGDAENQASSKAHSPGRSHKGKTPQRVSRVDTPKKEEGNPFIAAVTANLDVTSFPALLPRAKTSDWITPLPDISAPIAIHDDEMSQVRRQTLHHLGFDTTQSALILRNEQKEWPLHEGSSMPSGLNTETLRLSNKHTSFRLPGSKNSTKSVILQHPEVHLSRKNTGENGTGNAIGISSGRRKSSGYALKSTGAGTIRESPDPGSRSGSGPLVEALMSSIPEDDLRKKSLSHHAEKHRIKTHPLMGEPDRSCMDHSRTKMERIHDEVGKSNKTDPHPAVLIEPTSPFAAVINNTIPGGVTSCLDISPPLSTPKTPKASPSRPPPPKRGASFRGSRATSPKTQYTAFAKSPDRLSPISREMHSPRKLRDRLVKGKSQATVEDDCVGIYITMTGATGAESERGESHSPSLCSLGCESHNCGGWSN